MRTRKRTEDKPPIVVSNTNEASKIPKPRILIRRVGAMSHSVVLEFPEETPTRIAIAEPVNSLVDLSKNLDTAIAVANGARRALNAVADILPQYTNEYWKTALDSVPVVHVDNPEPW